MTDCRCNKDYLIALRHWQYTVSYNVDKIVDLNVRGMDLDG